MNSTRCPLVAALLALPLMAGCCTQMPSTQPATAAQNVAPAPQKTTAAPSAPAAAKAAGTWSWTLDAGGNTITQSVTLTQDGEKLTGKFTDGFDNTTHDIKDGKIHDGMVSFTVVRPFMDNGDLTLKFEGKLEGAAITGKVTFTIADQPNSADWNAKRSST